MIGPIGMGLLWTVLPAFGHLPAAGAVGPGLAPWRDILEAPGVATALGRSLATGIAATVLSLALALSFCACFQSGRWFRRAEPWLAPLLAAPHVALALGLAFLVAPAGWIARLLAGPFGWDRPPLDWPIEERGVSAMVLGLAVKETPFLILMLIAAAARLDVGRRLAVARALGHGPRMAYLKVAVPALIPAIRLPLMAVLAYSLSVVDVALVLGPDNPPTLAVMAQRWFSDPDPSLHPRAAAASLVILAITLATMAAWLATERVLGLAGRWWIEGGGRDAMLDRALLAPGALALVAGATGVAALLALALWSVAGVWWFPAASPSTLTLGTWAELTGPRLLAPLAETVLIAVASTACALVLSVLCLEAGRRMRALYLPLLIPQIAFLFGAQVGFTALGLDGSRATVIWCHLLFVLPYAHLALSGPWRALDPRYLAVAAGLGAGPWRRLLAVRLPLMLPAILAATALGLAVSVGQYLPTLFAGAGRVATLTTEAVALSSGGERRVVGVFAVTQALVPLIGFALALAIPRWLGPRC